MKKLFGLSVVVLILVGSVLFLSPYYKLYIFKNAYEQGNYTPIIESIDFETLRPNLKSQFYTKMDAFIAQNELATALSFLGVKPEQLHNYGVRFIDNAVDKAVTPDNLTALATGQITKDSEPLLIGIALASGVVDVPALAQSYFRTGDIEHAISEQKSAIAKRMDNAPTPKPTLSYCGFNCFAIDTKLKAQPIRIVMTRHNGVDWRIDNVILTN